MLRLCRLWSNVVVVPALGDAWWTPGSISVVTVMMGKLIFVAAMLVASSERSRQACSRHRSRAASSRS
jgi:hypothetical protein